MECPKCGAELLDDAASDCSACGVVLAKAVSHEFTEQKRHSQRLRRQLRTAGPTADLAAMTAKRSLLIGAAVAIAVYVFPLSRFIFSYLAILVHELGHTVAGFLFGYPSFPSFDFLYGGGVTLYFGRSIALLFLVGALWVGLAVRLRHWPRLLVATVVVGALWAVMAATAWHQVALNALGHGAELLFAGWCFYKALSGNVRNSTERWLYAACGFFLVLLAWVFALRLIESQVARREYEQAKGGGHWMDMSRIARFFEMDLVSISVIYWLAATALPVAVYLLWINRSSLVSFLSGSSRSTV